MLNKKQTILIALCQILCISLAANAHDYPTASIIDNFAAQDICPSVCHNHNKEWNGQWKNLDLMHGAVCGCKKKHARDYETNPIANNYDAQNKCPSVCQNQNKEWNGQWRNLEFGSGAVCGCKRA